MYLIVETKRRWVNSIRPRPHMELTWASQLQVNDPCVAIEDDAEGSTDSRSESDTDDEAELSGEEALENDDTSLLRPHDMVWMLTEGIQVNYFQSPTIVLSLTWDFGCHISHMLQVDRKD